MSSNTTSQKNPVWAAVSPFLLGGASGMVATTIIQPIDFVKVRIQISGEGMKGVKASPFALAARAIKEEGIMGMYSGLSAALLRQATYTTARMGLFRTFSNYFAKGEPEGAPLPFAKKAAAGLLAGGIGSVFGTPADVSLVRMQSDKTLPMDQRRNYKNVGDALMRILKEEGVGGLFAGNTPVVLRAMLLNVGMLSTYDQALDSLRPHLANPLALSVSAKFVSGFFASFLSLPADFLRIRLQKQKRDPKTGQLPYRNLAHCFARVCAEEGPMTLYRGFWTYYVRIAPHAMITLTVLDVLKGATKDW